MLHCEISLVMIGLNRLQYEFILLHSHVRPLAIRWPFDVKNRHGNHEM
jgi:hypothetical protein